MDLFEGQFKQSGLNTKGFVHRWHFLPAEFNDFLILAYQAVHVVYRPL